jgi:hypothetical protein
MLKILKNLPSFLTLLGILIFALFSGSFYWSQIRPVMAKRACSWFTEITPADPGITKDQAEKNRKEYENFHNEGKCYGGVYDRLMTPEGRAYETDMDKVLDISKTPSCLIIKQNSTERPPQPEKREIRPASEDEYRECLRHKGL